jgi:hypothetical protein
MTRIGCLTGSGVAWRSSASKLKRTPRKPPDRRQACASAGSARAVVSYPGRLQLDHPPGRVVHLRYGQAEPVPKAPEPFAAGPGDRLLQLAPVDEVWRARGGAGHGWRRWCGLAVRAFVICWWLPLVIVISLAAWSCCGRLPGWCRHLMSPAALGSSITGGQRASPHATAHANTHMIRPPGLPRLAPAPRRGAGRGGGRQALAGWAPLKCGFPAGRWRHSGLG